MTAKRIQKTKRSQRNRAKLKKVSGGKMRLSVFRSAKNISAQIIDDAAGKTVAAASTLDKSLRESLGKGADKAAAARVGAALAQRAKDAGVTDVVFDRGGYIYNGRIKALADAAREAGLKF